MSAVQRIMVDPLVDSFFADMRLAPRQFVETFLEQEGLMGLARSYLGSLGETELELFAMRWSTHASGRGLAASVRYLPGPHYDAGSPAPRPEYLDQASVAEMMRGMFHA